MGWRSRPRWSMARFLVRLGVAEGEAHEEAVELGLGEGEGAFVVDGVLGGDEEKGGGEVEDLAHRAEDLALGHGLEKRGLGARGGAVDLIGEQDLGKERPGTELELGGFGIVNGGSGDVVGQGDRGSTLNAFERALDALGEGAGEHGFGDAGDVLKEEVTLGEEGGKGELNLLALADKDFFDVFDQPGGHPGDFGGSGVADQPRWFWKAGMRMVDGVAGGSLVRAPQEGQSTAAPASSSGYSICCSQCWQAALGIGVKRASSTRAPGNRHEKSLGKRRAKVGGTVDVENRLPLSGGLITEESSAGLAPGGAGSLVPSQTADES